MSNFPETLSNPNPMPKQSIVDLKNAIESAPEMTAQHREEMLGLVDSLAKEVDGAESEDLASAEKLREAIAVAGEAVRRRAEKGGQEAEEEDHDLAERLSELEEKVEMVAIEHPVIASVLAALGRLV